MPFLRPFSDKQIDSILVKVESALEERPLKMKEIKERVPDVGDAMRWIVIMAMCEGKIIRAYANHARNPQTTYGLTEKWLEKFTSSDSDEDSAVREIIQKYVKLFGPVTLDDISWWLPATKTKVKSVIKDLGEQVVSLDVEGNTCYVDIEDFEIAASLESSSDPHVSFLPYEDHFAKAFIDRSWYLSEEVRGVVFPDSRNYYWPPECLPPPKPHKGMKQSGEKRPSIWVNGRIVGRWEFEGKGEQTSVVYKMLENISKKAASLIEESRTQLEEFVLKRLVPISKKGAVKDPPQYHH